MSAGRLEVERLTVQFGGVVAVDSVSFTAAQSTVHGLVGPNGSGKTTILNAVCGFVESKGQIRLDDRRIDGLRPHRRLGLRLGRTFQNPRSTRDLTVLDLLRLGEHLRGTQPWWLVAFVPLRADSELEQSIERAVRLLEIVGLDRQILDRRLLHLPSGVLKMVDIVRALMGDPEVLLLDEPTSGMSDREIELLHAALLALRSESLTLVLVEHNLRFMFDVCETATVLDAGRVVADGSPAEVFRREEVIRAYIGDSKAVTPWAPRPPSEC
jgi:branched-chain amino acid transport system ATP-binding protein